MSARRGILAGGNWLIDHVKLIDQWPPQDGLAHVLGRTAGNGGGPYNVLKDLAKLGAPFPLEAVGLLGDDGDGRAIRADVAAHRIDATQLHTTTAAATSSTDVMTVRATGRRTFFHDPGANALLAPEHFDFARARTRHFHLAYLLLLDALDAPGPDGRPRSLEVLRRARAAGLTTSVDCVSARPERYPEIVAPALAETDVLFANDFEAEQLTGLQLGRGPELRRDLVAEAARALVARGVRAWALVHFPEGVCACSAAGELLWQPAVRVPASEIVGTAGAGDALAAGVLLGWHEGWPMARALELGVCAAAASLRDGTCSNSVEPVDVCLALGRKHGFLAQG
ncbi:MAG: carbohydrate kinase family protein [Verrucomicrobia bacterium]|nr:carbohydrate kinase family protein [Verrucomicrobiota bacterium]